MYTHNIKQRTIYNITIIYIFNVNFKFLLKRSLIIHYNNKLLLFKILFKTLLIIISEYI